VHRALQSLTRQQREALVLVEWLGFDSEEAASILGIRASSVRTRLHRARTALRTQLGGIDE
jgi:RNA polymerase sigma-70 factor (ECF subfamily)